MLFESHRLIIRRAVKKFKHPLFRKYANELEKGCVDEDWPQLMIGSLDLGITGVNHAYNPETKKGFAFFKNAKEKAGEYFHKAVEHYKQKNHSKAFEYLGRCSHMLGDVATPAHTQNLPHYVGYDDYEHFLENNIQKLKFKTGTVRQNVKSMRRKTLAKIVDEVAKFSFKLKYCEGHKFHTPILKVMGLVKREKKEKLHKMSHQLVPMTLAATLVLFQLFLIAVKKDKAEKLAGDI